MFKKFNLSISLLGLLLLCSCSKIPNSAYICFDIQSDKKVFMLTYHKGMGVVSSDSELTSDDFSSDWVADGLSRYNKDDWYSDRNNPIQEENGIVIEYFDFMNVTMENDSLEFILPEFKDFTFKDFANFNCSLGISFHASIRNLTARGRLKKILIITIPFNP